MIKAIFFDIDGTLVSFRTHTVPESTRKALKQLHEQGVKLFIATGRPKLLINNLDDLEFDGYITLNGAHCFTADYHDIYKGSIPPNDIEQLVSYCKNHDYPFVFVHDNEWFITHVNADVEEISTSTFVGSFGHTPSDTKSTVASSIAIGIYLSS